MVLQIKEKLSAKTSSGEEINTSHFRYEIIDSTNIEAKRLIDKFLSERNINFTPFLISSQKQLSGKGRGQKTWESEEGNIFSTLTVDITKIDSEILSQISIFFAHIIMQLLRDLLSKQNKKFGIKIKWPNDVLIDNRKILGILPEIYKGYLILGFGINSKVAPEISGDREATSLKDYDIYEDNDFLVSSIIKKFFLKYDKFIYDSPFRAEVFQEINGDLDSIGEYINILKPDLKKINGKLIGLDDHGNLLLEQKNIKEGKFTILNINSGEILFGDNS